VLAGVELTKSRARSAAARSSGCGKSTLLRLIAGLEIRAKDILIGARRVTTVPPARATSAWCSRATRCIRT